MTKQNSSAVPPEGQEQTNPAAQPTPQNSSEEQADKLAECEKLKNEYLEGWQRARADFLNYQKAEQERIGQLLRFANEELISDLLLVLDSFDLAIVNAKDENEKNSFGLLRSQLFSLLKKNGLEVISVNKDEVLNPELHEVVEVVEVDGAKSQSIVEVVSRGYRLNGKVLRAAKVKVAK